MQCVIPVAGRGTRMKNLTDNVPKPMLKIKGRPILEYKLDALPDEINEVIFIVGYKKNKIQEHFGDKYGDLKITYVIQEELNGTGGAIHCAKDILSDKFMVLYGDDLYRKEDLEKMINHEFAVLSYEVEDPKPFGVFDIDSGGNLIDIVEKPENPPSNLVNIGAFVVGKDFFNYKLIPVGGGEFGFPQTLATMAKEYPIKIIKAGEWYPIGNPEELEEAEKVLDKFLKK